MSTLLTLTSDVVPSVQDRLPEWVRTTYDIDAGEVKFYTSDDGVSWTLFTTVVVVDDIVSLIPSTVPAVYGDKLEGALLYAEARDGINGTVVASMDPELHTSGDTWTSAQGHTLTVNHSGDATAEIADRACWQFTSAEILTITDRPELNFGTDDFSVAVGIKSHAAPAVNSVMVSKKNKLGTGDTPGFLLGLFTTPDIRFQLSDGTTGGNSFTASYLTGEWETIAGVREGDFITAYPFNSSSSVAALGSIDNTDALVIGSTAINNTSSIEGLINWVAVFSKVLTAGEISEIDAWNGSVDTEPVWLRDLAIFYINADDPWQADYYDGTLDTNRVLNLGAAIYGDFGWNIEVYDDTGNSTLITELVSLNLSSTHATPTYGDKYLYAHPITESGDTQGKWGGKITSTPVGPVTVGQTYTGSVDLGTNGTSWPSDLRLIWFDDDGEIGRSADASIDLNTGAELFARFGVTDVAPTGATRVALQWDSGTTPLWLRWYADRACIREGASTEWVPSLRAREDLDIRMHLKPTKILGPATQYIASKWGVAGDKAWFLYLNTSGKLLMTMSEDGTAVGTVTSSVALPYSDMDAFWIRVVFSASASLVTYYTSDDGVSWTQLGDSLSQALTGVYPGTGTVKINHLDFDGIIYEVEQRDGIDGPVILDLDADNLTGISSTLPSGLTVDLQQGGSFRPNILDRAAWRLSGADYLAIFDRSDFDIGDLTTDEFAVYAGITYEGGPVGYNARILSNASYGTAPGFGLYVSDTSDNTSVYLRNDAGTITSITGVNGVGDDAWHSVGFHLKDNVLTLTTDTATETASSGSGSITPTRDIYVGKETTDWFIGFISWAAVWNRALTTGELASLAAWDGYLTTKPSFMDEALVHLNASDGKHALRYPSFITNSSAPIPETTENVWVTETSQHSLTSVVSTTQHSLDI